MISMEPMCRIGDSSSGETYEAAEGDDKETCAAEVLGEGGGGGGGGRRLG